jgi:hypothetical protein
MSIDTVVMLTAVLLLGFHPKQRSHKVRVTARDFFGSIFFSLVSRDNSPETAQIDQKHVKTYCWSRVGGIIPPTQ